MKQKYQYSEESTIHQPLEVQANGIHTWTLVLNGEEYRVTREVWEAYHTDTERLHKIEQTAQKVVGSRGILHHGTAWDYYKVEAKALDALWELLTGIKLP